MNTQEDTMHVQRPTKTFIAHSRAVEAAGIAISVVLTVPAPLKSIADQVIRSASSVPAQPALGWLASQAKVAESELGSDR